MSQEVLHFEVVRVTPSHCIYAVNPEYGAVGFTLAQVVGYAGQSLFDLHALGWKSGAVVSIAMDPDGRVQWAKLNRALH